tara:strand:- start:4622 stop:4795 length:174 start_codon:yes stop_codon:yes gene_type:complete
MRKSNKIEQFKAFYRLKIILARIKNDFVLLGKNKRILGGLIFLEEEMKKFNKDGDKY